MSTEEQLENIFKDMISDGQQIIPKEIRDNYEKWDSLANMMLFMAINGEFGDILSFEDMEEFTSYENILKLVSARV